MQQTTTKALSPSTLKAVVSSIFFVLHTPLLSTSLQRVLLESDQPMSPLVWRDDTPKETWYSAKKDVGKRLRTPVWRATILTSSIGILRARNSASRSRLTQLDTMHLNSTWTRRKREGGGILGVLTNERAATLCKLRGANPLD